MKRIAVITLLIAALLIALLAPRGPDPRVEDRRAIAVAVERQRERDLEVLEHPSPFRQVDAAPAPKHAVSQREALLERIAQARTDRIVGARGSATDEPPPIQLADQTGDKSDWNKRTLATLDRLLAECYSLARADEPDLAGTVTLLFTIAGEPQVGGVIEQFEFIDAKSSLTQPTLRECMQESLYALELDPPPVGVLAQREVSLRFP